VRLELQRRAIEAARCEIVAVDPKVQAADVAQHHPGRLIAVHLQQQAEVCQLRFGVPPHGREAFVDGQLAWCLQACQPDPGLYEDDVAVARLEEVLRRDSTSACEPRPAFINRVRNSA